MGVETAPAPLALVKRPPDERLTALPAASDLTMAPAAIVRSDDGPETVTRRAPRACMEAKVRLCALLRRSEPTGPLEASVPIMFAPVSATVPSPPRVSNPAVSVPPPEMVAPLATSRTPVEPALQEPESSTLPALTVIGPVWLLSPARVSVPVPSLMSDKAPAPLRSVPEKLVLALLPPAVSVAAAPELVTVPSPASEPMLVE